MSKVLFKGLNLCIVLILVFSAFSLMPGLSVTAAASSEYNQDIISPLQLATNKQLYKPGEDISIFIQNRGNYRVNFETLPKIKIYDETGNVVYPPVAIRNYQSQLQTDEMSIYSQALVTNSWSLDPGEYESYLFDQVTISTDSLSPGVYTIETTSELSLEMEARVPIIIRDMGYVILVAGNSNNDKQARIDEACNQIYDDLSSIGYSGARIQYLNGWSNWRVDDQASSDNFEDAIKVWAADKVSITNPLFIVMFDHGGNNHFCVDDPPTGDNVWAASLDSWLDGLEDDTNAPVYIYYMGCHSGSFIDEISKLGRIMITSSSATENSGTAPAPYHEKLTSKYWPRIKAGDSLLEAFNVGTHYVAETLSSYHSLLDDNGDGVGHGWDTPNPSGYLPHDGDGDYAATVYMGGPGDPEMSIPWIENLVAKRAFELPIPPEPDPIPIPITAKIGGPIPIAKVTACVIPPIVPNYQETIKLEDVQYEYFEMSDPDGDGTWSVDIPSSVFAELKPAEFKPAEFKIMVIVEDVNGQTAVPGVTNVEFTRNGELSADYTPPALYINSPKYLDNVQGTVFINAVAMDDTSVKKAQVVVDDIIVDSVNLPKSSTNTFECEIDTSDLLDGIHDVQIQIEDTSGNIYSKSTTLIVVNNAIQIPAPRFKQSAIAELELAKTRNKKIDEKIDCIIDIIGISLGTDLWLDPTHLDPERGHRVFSLEKQAVKKLEELMNHKNLPDSLITTCDEVILKLVNSDFSLAKTSIDDAQLEAGSSKNTDHQLALAQQNLHKSYDAIADGNYGSAIDCYRQSWGHAQKTLG